MATADEAFFLFLRESCKALLPEYNMTLVSDEVFPYEASDFRTYLRKVSALKPEAFLYFQASEQGLISFFKTKQQRKNTIPVFGIHDFEGFLQNKLFASLMTNLTYSSFETTDKSFNDRFQKRFNQPPILSASYAYDAMNLILAGYASGAKTPEDFAKFFKNNEHDTVTYGKSRFDDFNAFTGGKFVLRTN